jgi:phosphatidylglycerophosphatase A
MAPDPDPRSADGGPLHPAAVAAGAGGSPPDVDTAPGPAARPGLRFLVASPAHFVALGAGSGLAPFAAGTWGTLLALASFRVFDRWLSDVGWAVVVGIALAVGAWAAQRTGARLGHADSPHIVIDEIAAFWLVLWLLPVGAPAWLQAAAFVLFRAFDIAKPPPIARLDARLKNGVGVMLDDLVAAFYTLAAIAIFWRLTEG